MEIQILLRHIANIHHISKNHLRYQRIEDLAEFARDTKERYTSPETLFCNLYIIYHTLAKIKHRHNKSRMKLNYLATGNSAP